MVRHVVQMLAKQKGMEPLGSVCKQIIPGIKCFKNFKQMEDYSGESPKTARKQVDILFIQCLF